MISRKVPARRASLFIMIAASLAVIPMLFFGNSWGHDFDLHVPSWMEAEQQVRVGIVYPHWAAGAYYGFGEPFFIFYPPLSRTVGALLGLIFPWKMVPGAFVWLAMVLAGAAMWKCASEWLDPSDAAMASVLYAINPYLLVDAYKRCDYAELLASAFFPLLIWAGIEIGRDARKAVLPLSAVLAAIWLSNLPAGVVATYSLALLLLVNTLVHRSLRPALYGAIAILACFGSIAFFLLPAAWEQKWVNIGEALRYDWRPENNFLFTQNNTAQMLAFNRGLSFIALLLVMAAAIAAVLTRRLRLEAPNVWRSLTTLGGVSAFMMFPPSLILYRILPEMRFVEFPTRWLLPLCVVGAFLVSVAIAHARRKWTLWMSVAVVVGAVGAVIISSAHWDSAQHMRDVKVATYSGAGYRGLTGWCAPAGSQPLRLPQTAPLIAAVDPQDPNSFSSINIQNHIDAWLPEHKVFSVDSPRPLLLKIKLLNYPAWQAKLNGKIVPLETEKETGQMLLPVPAGPSRAEIKFIQTRDRTVGIAVSLTTVLALVLLMVFFQRNETSAKVS